jgi:hypothetical protein
MSPLTRDVMRTALHLVRPALLVVLGIYVGWVLVMR